MAGARQVVSTYSYNRTEGFVLFPSPFPHSFKQEWYKICLHTLHCRLEENCTMRQREKSSARVWLYHLLSLGMVLSFSKSRMLIQNWTFQNTPQSQTTCCRWRALSLHPLLDPCQASQASWPLLKTWPAVFSILKLTFKFETRIDTVFCIWPSSPKAYFALGSSGQPGFQALSHDVNQFSLRQTLQGMVITLEEVSHQRNGSEVTKKTLSLEKGRTQGRVAMTFTAESHW